MYIISIITNYKQIQLVLMYITVAQNINPELYCLELSNSVIAADDDDETLTVTHYHQPR